MTRGASGRRRRCPRRRIPRPLPRAPAAPSRRRGTAAGSMPPSAIPSRRIRIDVLPPPAAQVAERLLDRHPPGMLGRDPPDSAQGVVRAITRGADDRGHRGRRPVGAPGEALGDFQDGLGAGLVVREVHDDRPPAQPEQVHPPRRQVRGRAEVAQAVGHLLQGDAHRPRSARRRQRIGHVVAGQTAERDRQVRDVEDLVLIRPVPLHQVAVAKDVRPAAGTAGAGRVVANRRGPSRSRRRAPGPGGPWRRPAGRRR